MEWNIIKNIVLIILILLLLFILGDDPEFNKMIKKRKINIFILLILIYFIYSDFPLIFILIVLLVFLGLNKNFYHKFILNNKLLKKYNVHEYFDNDSYKQHKEKKSNTHINRNTWEQDEDIKRTETIPYDFKPHLVHEEINEEHVRKDERKTEQNDIKEENKPFQKNVQEIREQFDSILSQFKTS